MGSGARDPANDPANLGLLDTEAIGDPLLDLSSSDSLADRDNISIGKFRVEIAFAPVLGAVLPAATLARSIPVVIAARADE